MEGEYEISVEQEERFWRSYIRYRRLWVLLIFGGWGLFILGVVLLAVLDAGEVIFENRSVELGVGLAIVVPLLATNIYVMRRIRCPRCRYQFTSWHALYFPESCPRCDYALESQYRDRLACYKSEST